MSLYFIRAWEYFMQNPADWCGFGRHHFMEKVPLDACCDFDYISIIENN